MLPRSTTSSIRCSPYSGRAVGGLAASASTLAPGSRGFTPASQFNAHWIGWLACIALSRGNAYWPLHTVQAFSASWHLLCPRLTPAGWSKTIAGPSVPRGLWPAGTPRRSPGVSPWPVGAQPLDLRLWSLMDMDFVLSRALVRPQRLLSSFCPSARTFAPRFLQTAPHDVALALR